MRTKLLQILKKVQNLGKFILQTLFLQFKRKKNQPFDFFNLYMYEYELFIF